MDKTTDRKSLYIGGDIMSRGSFLARQEEYDKIAAENLSMDVYSPIMNKSINDKSHMTEEENNHLAEKIVAADVERLWNSDYTIMCPEQHAIGTICEVGILYGWKYMEDKLYEEEERFLESEEGKAIMARIEKATEEGNELEMYKARWEFENGLNQCVANTVKGRSRNNYFHYSDIRTNHLNEKDWRRSFSINQFLYGIILAASKDGKLYDSFDEVLEQIKKPERGLRGNSSIIEEPAAKETEKSSNKTVGEALKILVHDLDEASESFYGHFKQLICSIADSQLKGGKNE